MVWFKSVDCLGYPEPAVFPNTNCFGFNAVPCNGPLRNYQVFVGDASQEERSNFYMSRRNANVDITTIYPWRRDITATSTTYATCPGTYDPSWQNFQSPLRLGGTPNCSVKDLCTEPNGVAVNGVTQIGLRLYKSPTNGLPPFNSEKCYDCRVNGKNCGNCQGVY